MISIPIARKPFGDNILYTKCHVDFDTGLTVLVGCNGSGKTTMMTLIKNHLEKTKVPYIAYDNLRDGGNNAIQRAAFYQDFEFVATAFGASEGEQININLGTLVKDIGRAVRKHNGGQFWILLDAVDSGLSVDNIIDLKEFLTDCLIPDAEAKGVEIYVIAVANEYEMCRDAECVDVRRCAHVRFKDYDDYRAFILESRKAKDKRKT